MQIVDHKKQLSFFLGVCFSAVLLFQNMLPAAEPTDVEIKALIEQLASTNKAPTEQELDLDFPENLRSTAQQKVWAAYHLLKAIGPRSYSILFAAHRAF